jgi:hypothetical protein
MLREARTPARWDGALASIVDASSVPASRLSISAGF